MFKRWSQEPESIPAHNQTRPMDVLQFFCVQPSGVITWKELTSTKSPQMPTASTWSGDRFFQQLRLSWARQSCPSASFIHLLNWEVSKTVKMFPSTKLSLLFPQTSLTRLLASSPEMDLSLNNVSSKMSRIILNSTSSNLEIHTMPTLSTKYVIFKKLKKKESRSFPQVDRPPQVNHRHQLLRLQSL